MIRWLALLSFAALCLFAGVARAETYTTAEGQAFIGEAMGPDTKGVVIKKIDGSLSERIAWTNWSVDALKKMSLTLPKATVQRSIEPLLAMEEPLPEARPRPAVVQPKFTAPARLDRPVSGAGLGTLFTSPLTIFLLLVVYAANIYAGYEVAKFRNFSPPMVCGVAAIAPVIGPAIFLSMKTNLRVANEAPLPAPTPEEQVIAEAAAVEAAPEPKSVEAAPAKPRLPEPIIFQRGTTMFNRRFCEMKLAGFLKLVPGESEKDMLIYIKSARGEYAGPRLAKLEPNELYLLVRKGEAFKDVMIPYGEILELRIQHKDIA
jgi:hypothetical protein